MSDDHAPAIEVRNLTFSYATKPVLKGVSMTVRRGERVVLVGDNGAGKTTLLRIMAGKHMVPLGTVEVLGRRADFDSSLNTRRAYLCAKWGMRTVAFSAHSVPFEADIAVKDMMLDVQRRYPERRDKLMKLLDIDPDWRMNAVSDGQRRRVQLLLSMMPPYEVLMLDEVTTDIDVVTRQDLLAFLKEETETRGVCVVYATHIFDGLDAWATHLAYLDCGVASICAPLAEIPEYKALVDARAPSPLHGLVSSLIRRTRETSSTDAHRNALDASDTSERPKLDRDLHAAAGGYAPGRMASYYGQ